jgi:hypothetical protein
MSSDGGCDGVCMTAYEPIEWGVTATKGVGSDSNQE